MAMRRLFLAAIFPGLSALCVAQTSPPPASTNTSIPPSPPPIVAAPGAKPPANYDEAKANPYPLPDPLLLKNGQPVKDAVTWWKQRRPEILQDFSEEVYGRIPENTPKVTWQVTSLDHQAAGGIALKKTVVGKIDNSRYPGANPSINLTLYTPRKASGPVPVIVVVVPGPGGYGAPHPDAPAIPTPEPPPGSPLYQLLSIGWGYATMEVGPIQNDYKGGLTSGIIGLMSRGQPRNPDDWGALSAWAWGLSRAMDYFETDKSVDATQMGLEGHSRYGKTALLAAALDPRWAIVFPSCSGELGAKPSRRNWGKPWTGLPLRTGSISISTNMPDIGTICRSMPMSCSPWLHRVRSFLMAAQRTSGPIRMAHFLPRSPPGRSIGSSAKMIWDRR